MGIIPNDEIWHMIFGNSSKSNFERLHSFMGIPRPTVLEVTFILMSNRTSKKITKAIPAAKSDNILGKFNKAG